MSGEAWITRELQRAAEMADMPFIRVQPVFYEQVKALAEARGVLPESLMTNTEVTCRLMSLIDNLLI